MRQLLLDSLLPSKNSASWNWGSSRRGDSDEGGPWPWREGRFWRRTQHLAGSGARRTQVVDQVVPRCVPQPFWAPVNRESGQSVVTTPERGATRGLGQSGRRASERRANPPYSAPWGGGFRWSL